MFKKISQEPKGAYFQKNSISRVAWLFYYAHSGKKQALLGPQDARMHLGGSEQAKNNNNTDFTVRIPAAGAAVRSGTGTLRLQGRVPPVTHQKKKQCVAFSGRSVLRIWE